MLRERGYSNPNLPWGDGFNVRLPPSSHSTPSHKRPIPALTQIQVDATDTVNITMTHTPAPNNWTSTVEFGSHIASNTFPLGNKNFNQAILAIELTGVTWDFGELVWENVVMVSFWLLFIGSGRRGVGVENGHLRWTGLCHRRLGLYDAGLGECCYG